MSKELKAIPVTDQTQALLVISRLSREYGLETPDPTHQFRVSNEHYTAFYDAVSKSVKMETVHQDVTEEQIREFMINFPPFF